MDLMFTSQVRAPIHQWHPPPPLLRMPLPTFLTLDNLGGKMK